MVFWYLKYFCISILILHSTGQTVFDCSKSVAFGDSAHLTCYNLQSLVSINNPAGKIVGSCTRGTCGSVDGSEKINMTFTEDNTLLLTVHEIDKEDEGKWTCQSGGRAKCFLNVYKLPSCEISSTSSTNDLSLGQDLPLNINFTEYYCTNSIVWKFTIGGQSQNVTGFRDREDTDDITSRIVRYSPSVTSSLTGRVELTFNCNDETYAVSCSGVKELQLRDPPFCLITSDDDTEDLTVGNNLILKAAIEEYPCTTNIKYVLLSGSLMVAEFTRNERLFHATFEVKPEYLDKQLHLKYICNSVSETTRTEGVEILLSKVSEVPVSSSSNIGLAIGVSVGVISLVVLMGILITWSLKHRRSTSNETPFYDTLSYGVDIEARYQDLIRDDGTRPRDSDTQNIPDVEYENPGVQNSPDVEYETPNTQNALNGHYENIDDIEQVQTTERRTCVNDPQYGNVDSQ